MRINSLTNPNAYIDVSDYTNSVTPQTNCIALTGGGARCDRPGVTSISILTYDLADTIVVYPASISNAASISYQINSGQGADSVNMREYAEFDGSPSPASIEGQGGKDTISGSDVADTLSGSAGADQLYGYAGDDELLAGPGKDTLEGGKGIDVITARNGDRDAVIDCGPGDNSLERAIVDPVDPQPKSC